MTADDDLRRDAVELAERVMADPDRRKPSERLLARAVLAARSDITQAATGGPDFTPKEWPEPRAEGLRGYDPLAPEEVAELRADPMMVHLYDAHRLVSLLLAATPPPQGLDVDALIDELSESPLPGARYAVTVVKYHAEKARRRAALAPEQPE